MNACFGRTPGASRRPCTSAISHVAAVWPRPAIRPIEASKAAICNGRFTSIRDIAANVSNAQEAAGRRGERFKSDPKAIFAQASGECRGPRAA